MSPTPCILGESLSTRVVGREPDDLLGQREGCEPLFGEVESGIGGRERAGIFRLVIGGRVVLVALTPEKSTTALVETNEGELT